MSAPDNRALYAAAALTALLNDPTIKGKLAAYVLQIADSAFAVAHEMVLAEERDRVRRIAAHNEKSDSEGI